MIITFTNVIGAIRNAISSVITTNLKMWLGFETSETLGRELNDLTWNDNGGWTINSDIASNDGTGSTLTNAILQVGNTYEFKCKLSSYTSGDFRLMLGSNTISTNFSSTDEFTFIGVCTGDGDARVQSLSGIGSLSISSLSIKELTQITPDKSSNNNVGELFTGKVLEFDGQNDTVNIDFTTPIKSAVFWVKPLDTGIENIMWFGGAFSGSKYIRSNGNVIQTAGLSSVSVYVDGVQTTNVPLNQWSRVVVNFASVTPSELKFGYAYNSYGYIQLSNVQLYNENLSTDDIAFDYANPNKLAIDNPSTSLSVTNLKGYWALSEGDGLVAYDSGTNLEEDVVVNGGFDTDSDWTEGVGWDIDVVNKKATCDGTQTSNSNLEQVVYTTGKVYKTIITVDSVDAGSLSIFTGNTSSQLTITEADTYTIIIEASTSNSIYIQANEFFEGSISNVSVREVTASDHGGLINGADYVDAQPRIPQLGMQNWSKGSNLVTYSEDFSQSVWTKNQLTQTYGFASPTGQLNATKLTATNTDPYILFTLSGASTDRTYSASAYIKGTASTIGEDVRLWIIKDSIFHSQDFTLTSDWQRISTTKTFTSDVSTSILFRLDTPNTNVGVSDEVFVWATQLEKSSSSSAYRLTDGGATLNSTVIPNPTIPTQDIFGNAVRDRLNSFNLDGSGYAEVADDADLNFGTGDFTLECWVRIDGNTVRRLLDKRNTTSGYTLYLTSSNVLKLELDDNTITGNIGFDLTSNLSSNTWLHLAIVCDRSANATCYVNKAAQTPVNISSKNGNIDSTSNLIIGADAPDGAILFSTDIISDVRLYKGKLLSATEVENNYNAGESAHTN